MSSPKEVFAEENSRKIIVGICCMDAKGKSKPMQQILNRLRNFPELSIEFFGEKVILNEPPERWPEVDCLITFFSTGFPLEKSARYMQLRPTTFCVNDPQYQNVLLDRRLVYGMLKKSHVPMVKHVIVNRDAPIDFKEFQDHIEVNGVTLEKPFVEKPTSGEDHNIHIYYHSKTGGGSVRLFRKVDNKSSQAYPEINNVRTNASYIYEEFVQTDAMQDVKMYTIGANYIHAESRKSPVVDGKVERDKDGKEIRYTVTLTKEEHEIARKIVRCFHQGICGFDVLRKDGQSYVCDVNGWSFVKGNQKYYDDCAKLLRQMFQVGFTNKGFKLVKPIPNKKVLRGVISVFRHADRTPKQKLKFKTWNKDVLGLFDDPHTEVKLKNDSNQVKLNRLLNTAKTMMEGIQLQIAAIAETTGGQPLSPTTDRPQSPSKVLQFVGSTTNANINSSLGLDPQDVEKLDLLITVLEKGYEGTKIQLKPTKFEKIEGQDVVVEALFVCKWGGMLTPAGIKQSHMLGRTFSERVFGDKKEEFLQDIQFISNNERRVRRTAEEFAKELFGKENLPNDLVQDNKETAKLLGMNIPGKRHMEKMKKQLSEMMHMYKHDDFLDVPGMKQIESPIEMMKEVHDLMSDIAEHLKLDPHFTICNGETSKMLQQRWLRLRRNFYNPKKDSFDTTKIPDVFDYITYDVIHNRKPLQEHDLYALLERAESMARFLVPAEYGIYPKDKFNIGSLICQPLVAKLFKDIEEIYGTNGPASNSKVRLYFGSESHLHTLRNILLYSEVSNFRKLVEPVELNYLTHFVFKLWENVDLDIKDPARYQIEVLFSSGTAANPYGARPAENHVLPILPMVSIHPFLQLTEFDMIVQKAFKAKTHQLSLMTSADHVTHPDAS